MNKYFRLGISITAVFWLSTSGAATIYKWTDEKGTVQYSSQPPSDRPFEKIKTSSGSSKQSNDTSASAPIPEQKKQEQAANMPPENRKDPERCAWAKRNMETLNTNSRIKIQDEKGEIRFLDQSEINEKRKEAQNAINESC